MKMKVKNKDKFGSWKIRLENSTSCEMRAIDKVIVDNENVKFFRDREWGEEMVFVQPLTDIKSMERV